MEMFPTKKSKVIRDLNRFSNKELSDYSLKRNFDFGPPHKNVSKLSPYLRTRFISEEEVIKIVSKKNNIKKIEKFIEEIFWRTYWRGWLESHPWIYKNYLNTKIKKTIPKKTGIKCFDYWKEELLETGYLHNHSRMWFASIWIFTLGYDWQSGANFFEKNLLDSCPASNTLSWRWVAGLQTINKPYIAKSDNINYFTNGRFNPKGQLKEEVILNLDTQKSSEILSLNKTQRFIHKNHENLGIILNKNDLSLNQIFDKTKNIYDCCIYHTEHENILINKFQNKLIGDILEKNKNFHFSKNLSQIFEWLTNKKIKNLIIPYETVGNKIFNNNEFINALNEMKIHHTFYIRNWDFNAFPHATKGFFKFKKNIPNLIELADI